MNRLPTLVAGGVCAILLLAGGGHAEPHRGGFRGEPAGRGYGAERVEPGGYGAPAPRGYGYEGRPSRGYGYEPAPPREERYGRSPPGYAPPPGYRTPAPPYRDGEPPYPPSGYRQNSLGADWREQQEEARAGVREGQMAPLGRVIQGIGRRSAGRPLDAGIEYQGGRAVYRVRWMTAHGRRVDYIVDAASGAILSEH